MGDRDGLQLVERLGHGDVENLFAPVAAGQTNCMPKVVLPVPALPSTRWRRPRTKPPPRMSSNPVSPDEALSLPFKEFSPLVQARTPEPRNDTSPVAASRIKKHLAPGFCSPTRQDGFHRNGHRMSISSSRNFDRPAEVELLIARISVPSLDALREPPEAQPAHLRHWSVFDASTPTSAALQASA